MAMFARLQFSSFWGVCCWFVSGLGSLTAQHPFAVSHGYLLPVLEMQAPSAERIGPWQLSRSTVARFRSNLPLHQAFDPRLDPEWSADIAAEYWNYLLEVFQDSSLADHALVSGATATRRLMANDSLMMEWPSIHRKWKRKRTRSFSFPADLAPISLEGPIDWQDLAGISYEQPEAFYRNNMAVQGQRLPKGFSAHLRLQRQPNAQELAVLHRKAELRDSIALAELEAERERLSRGIPDAATHQRLEHTVRSGEYLSVIGRKYQVSVKELKKWNNLHSDRINIGDQLVVYVEKSWSEPKAEEPAEARVLDPKGSVRSDEEDRKEEYYVVRSGDTLWSIARAYPGVSADDIMRWNGITENIKIDQVILILPLPTSEQL